MGTFGFDEFYGFGSSWCWIKNLKFSGERFKKDKEYHLGDVGPLDLMNLRFGGSRCWIKNPRISGEND